MKSTRTMKAQLSQSFIHTHSSLRSAGVDRFRLLLKGWSVKVVGLMVVLMVGGSVVGQVSATSTWALTANANALTTGAVSGGLQTGGSGIGAMTYGPNGVTSNGWGTTGIDANDYYQFNISPTSGNNLTISSVATTNNLSSQTATGEIQYSYSSSFTTPSSIGATFALTGTATTTTVSSLSISVTNGQTLYVRVFIYKGSGNSITNSQTVRCKDFTITGTTSSTSTPYYWGGTTSSYSGAWTTGTPWGTSTSSGETTAWPGSGSYSANFNAASGIVTIPNSITVAPATVNINAATTFNTSGANGNLGVAIALGSNTLTTAPNASFPLALSGIISGTGAVTNTTGTTTLSGANTYSGGTTITSGTLSTAANNNTGTGNFTMAGGTLGVTTGYSTSKTFAFSSGSTIDVASSQTLTTTGAFSGSNTITKANTGTLSVGAVNASTLKYNITGGTLISSNASYFAAPGSVVADYFTLNGGTLDLTTYSTTSANTGIRVSSNSSNTIVNTSSTTTIASPISDVASNTGTVTFGGGATIALTAANTYSGATTIASSTTLTNGINNALPTTTALTHSGSSYGLSSYTQTLGSLAGAGNINLVTGALTVGNSNSTSYTGTISGGTASSTVFTKVGSGTLTINSGNTYTGKTSITGGTIATSGESAFGASPGSFTANQITLNGGTIQSTGGIDFSSNRGITLGASGGTFNTSGGTITLTNIITGAGSLNKAGTGILIFNGIHTYTGATNINAGTAQLSSAAGNSTVTFIPDGSNVTLAASTTLNMNGKSETIGSLAGSGAVTSNIAGAFTLTTGNATNTAYSGEFSNGSGTGSLVKQGVGTFTLSGANTYTGATTISAGVLSITGSTAAGSTVSVASGASLVGTGAANGAVTVNGTISPAGNGVIGSFTTGNLTLSTGGTYYVDINNVNGTAGTNWDQVVAGTLTNDATVGSPFTISLNGTITGFSSTSNASWIIGTYTGTAPSTSNIQFLATGSLSGNTSNLSVSFAGNNITVSYTAPTSSVLVDGGSSTVTTTAFTTTYGTASTAQTFTIAGSSLTADVTVSAVTGFELSTDGSSYSSTASFAPSSGTVSGTLYIRFATTAVTGGTYNAQSFTVTSTNANAITINTSASGNTVTPAALTITASAQSKNFGVTSTTTGATSFTTSGLQGSDAVGTVTLTYSGSPAGNLATATAGSYTITPSAASFTAGSSSNYSITYASGSLTISAVVPGAPTIGALTAGNGQVTIAFTAPASTGGAAITSYTATSNPGGFTGTGSSSPISVTGLTNGTPYTFTVTATNSAGTGAASSASTSSTPRTVPDAPIIGTAAVVGTSGTATVTFTAPVFNGGADITSYSVTSIPAGGTGSINQAGSGTITVSGLTNGTAYTFTVKAINTAGASTASAASNSVTPYTVPGAPSIGTATAGNGQATVTFTAPASNGGSVILNYTVTSNPAGGSVTGATSPITVTGLTNGTAYTFTVKANNAAGASAASAASNSVTPVLPAPVANAASSVLVDGFTANWDAVTGATGYKLDVGTSSPIVSTSFSSLVTWNFPTGSTTSVASGGITANNTKILTTNATGGVSYSTTSASTLAALVSGWDAGSLSKYWQIDLETTGYYNVRVSSAQRSSNTGPRDFKLQYKIGSGGAWVDVTSGAITTAANFTTGVLSAVSLPSACDNQSSVFLRWIMTSNTSVNSGTVAGTGTSSIDDILIEGNAGSYITGYQDLTVSGTSQAVTGLSEGTTYYYRIRATDGSTSSNSNVITVTTKQTPTVTPTVGTYTYTGSAQGPNVATNTGTGSSYTFSYSGTGATTYGASSTRPTAAGSYTVTASVAANGNYVAASSSATAFSIAKATPTITVAPTATDILLGQALSTSTLSGGTATPAGGSFAFTSPSTVPSSVGSYSASVTYTPTDVANYNTATTTTNVLVVSPLTTISNTQFTSARDITRGTTELPIYRFQVDVTNVAATLSSLGFTTPVTATNGNSNYVNTDITDFKAFLTTSTTFSNATQLGATSPSGKTQQNAGETLINFTSLATTLNVGTTYYIWLTADVLSAAVAGRTITVNAPTIGITGTVSGTNSATGTQTIISVATNYYLNAGGSLTTSAHYFTSPNGVGTSLSAAGFSYTSNDVTLNIPSSVTNTSDFTLGNGSKIVVQNGGSLTVGASNTVTGTIDVNDGGTLTVNNTSVLHTLGTLGTTSSTVIYSANGNQTVAAKPYANLTISGSGVKTIGVGTSSVAGTLSLNAGTLDISTNTLVLNGLVSQSSGIIDADAGTLSFGNSADMSLLSTLFSGDIYNLSKSSGSGVLTVNDNLNITNNLSTSASTGDLVLASTKQLTVDGIITNNGTFTIENGATLKQTGTGANANTGSGTYNVKQNITGSGGSTPNGRFWYLGGALSDASSTALLSSTGNLLWQWNEASFGYTAVTSAQTLSQGKSYVLRSGQSTETINFSGASLSNGTVNVTGLSRTGTTQNYRGCHLISNPYPSYLDWNAITKTNIGTTMYIRTAIGTTLDVMETFNTVNNLATTISSVPLTQYIAPMQGFWVKVTTDNQTGSLTMDNSMRSHQPTGSGLRSTAQDFPAFLRFNMLDGQNKDQVILLMSPDATMSLDNFDSEKMSASGFAQFYSTVNATKLVINGMKNVKAKTSVPLTLVMPTSKSYTFQAEEFNIEDGLILLEDKQEGVIQDLTINPTYSFFGNAGTNATRFVVHFQLATAPVLVGGPQELESLGSDELTTDNIQIVSNNQGTVIIRLAKGFKPEGSIRIFDASGRLVEQTDFNDQETTIHLNEQAGMYFVEVSAGKLMVKKKIVIE